MPEVEPDSTRMLLCVRGLLMPLSTEMLLAIVAPVELPSMLMPAVTLSYTVFATIV